MVILKLAILKWRGYIKVGNTNNQVIQNSEHKFTQRSIISEKPGYLSKTLKTLTSSNCHKV